jgi:predicted MFS family arabinose efflux permease
MKIPDMITAAKAVTAWAAPPNDHHWADRIPHSGRSLCDPGDSAVFGAGLSGKPGGHEFCGQREYEGMAVAGLFFAFFSRQINRRFGILTSLCVLAIPTALLASAPDLTTFTILRVAQGLCMASAFTLTLAYLGEECSATDAGGAFAAYITGNVASNLIGRLISAGVADHFGLAANFYFFSALNLAGAVLVYFTIRTTMPILPAGEPSSTPLEILSKHLRNSPLLASFGIGFCILFAFIGTFTYVNFVLVREPLLLGHMALGFVYFVFLPSIVTTPFAGAAVQRFGTRPTFWSALALAGLGLPLLLLPNFSAVIAGLMLVGVGTFFAQAAATSFIGRVATADRGSASGIYLALLFLWWTGWHCRPWPDLRSVRMAGVRRRDRFRFGRGGVSGHSPPAQIERKRSLNYYDIGEWCTHASC